MDFHTHKKLKVMDLLVIIAAVIAGTCATPVAELLHPSPVNPDVLVAIKPEERIILITDPMEIVKFKREAKQPLFPTVLPENDKLHTTNIDQKSEIKTFAEDSNAKNCVQNSQDTNKSSVNSRKRRNVEFQNSQAILPSETKQNADENILKTKSEEYHQEKADNKHPAAEIKEKPQGLPTVHSLHQEIDISKIQSQLPQKENNEFNKNNNQEDKIILSATFQKTEELPVFFSLPKRDIPVPLIAKHHHPEESSNEFPKEKFQKIEITNEQFQKPQAPPLVLKKTNQEVEQHKRDIPVPLVPKHHHSEEYRKELDDQEHLTKIEQVKPQMLPAIMKETSNFTPQQKRETIKPAVSNQGSPKGNDSHEANKNSEEKLENHVKQDHHVPHTLLTQSHEHITIHNSHKPQILPIPSVSNKDHVASVNAQNSQVLAAANQQKSVADHHKVKEVNNNAEHPNKHEKEPDSQQDHKANIPNANLGIRDLETSTTEHPLIRNRPVPVAELFSRGQGN